MAEQRALLAILRAAFSMTARLAAAIETKDQLFGRIEEAALAKAFRGELVPQDPTDEPAAVHLDRIRAARAAEPERPRRGRGSRPGGAPAPTGATNGHSSAADHDDSLDLVIAAFQSGPPRLAATAITATTGLAAAAVKQALQPLVAAGQVRVHGKARGTTYEWCP